METEVLAQNRKLDALSRLKGNIETLAKVLKSDKTYKVRSGDSLEKIAKMHQTDVATLKKLNDLANDRIVVDQELKLP
jgi:LysM repeat protein